MTTTLAPDPTAVMASPLPLTLALQGGGSRGAFTWGVLECLLDRRELAIGAVSGTSAGALNAAFLAQGLASGGRAEARRLLEAFWRAVAASAEAQVGETLRWLGPFPALLAPWVDVMRSQAPAMARRQLNPSGRNPIAGILDDLLEPRAFARPGAPRLIVAATRVRTGQARLFEGAGVTAEVLLASACLPQLFPAVEIDGEPYWDGGYASNPPIRALIEAGAPADLLVVRTTPVERLDPPPEDAVGLLERTNEMMFGAALRHELGWLAFAQQLLREHPQAIGVRGRLREARLHMIGAEEAFRALPGGSRQDPTPAFIEEMRLLGQEAAEAWLSAHQAMLGRGSTLDLAAMAGEALSRRPPGAAAAC